MEITELAEHFGWEKAPESIDEFKELHSKEFTPLADVKNNPEIRDAIIKEYDGKRFGIIEQVAKKWMKELEIDGVEGEKLEEKLENTFLKVKEKVDKIQTETKKTKSQIEEQLSGDLEKYKKQLAEKEELLTNANSLIEQKEKEFEGFKFNLKKESELKQIYDQIKFTDEYQSNPVTREGFNSIINKELEFGFDGDNFIVTDKKGNAFKNEAGNKVKTPLEVLDMYADKYKVKKNNDLNGKSQPSAIEMPDNKDRKVINRAMR